jgi:ABC-type lipoprotein release transport system permease subunit
VIGSEIAEEYGVELGDTFNLTIRTAFETRTFTLKAVGIFYPQPPLTSTDVFVDFKKAQEMTGLEGNISVILVKLKDSTKAMKVRDLLQNELEVEFEVLAPKIERSNAFKASSQAFSLD